MNAPRQTILVVDDNPENLSVISSILKEQWRVKACPNGDKALQLARSEDPPDLILLDVVMPMMDGYTVCEKLKSDPRTADIPVVFLTSRDESSDEAWGLYLGAIDYLTKPVRPAILRARVRNLLQYRMAQKQLESRTHDLESEVLKRSKELLMLQDVTILALASLAETRDNETGNHIRRTQNYVEALALRIKDNPAFAGQLDKSSISLITKSAPLHDIGKVGIPDAILLKPGKLTAEEFEIMKGHSKLGYDAIANAASQLETTAPFLRFASEIAHYHHEKWDGSGYPEGLSGDSIPLSARLMALADVYDALISKRVYKPAFPHEKAAAIIMEGRGTHFDPRICDAFLALQDHFMAIANEHPDEATSSTLDSAADKKEP